MGEIDSILNSNINYTKEYTQPYLVVLSVVPVDVDAVVLFCATTAAATLLLWQLLLLLILILSCCNKGAAWTALPSLQAHFNYKHPHPIPVS